MNVSCRRPRLMAVLAHPDDESLGVGGTLAKYASEGVDVFLLTATRGDGGRYRGHRPDDPQHPGPLALAKIREAELRAAASVLGVREVSLLDYHDQHLDRADPRRGCREHCRAPEAGSARRRRDVRPRRRLRASGSHRDLAIHHGGHRRRGRRRVCGRRRRRGDAAACGVEALLHRVAGIDVGGLPGSGRDTDRPRSMASNGRRRRGPTGRSPR